MLANVWHNGPGSVRDLCFLGTTTEAPVGTLCLFIRGAGSRIYNMLGTRLAEPASSLARGMQQAKDCGLQREGYGTQ
jgi:hypothetical protein